MKLHGIDFGPCLDAAGVRGFFGEGYWFHRIPLINWWFDFRGSVRVAKTTTLAERAGNIKLDGFTQREWFPRCIWWSWVHGIVLNAVGLGGPGALYLFDHGLVYTKGTFMISFMSVADTKAARLEEFRAFIAMLDQYLWRRRQTVAVQINLSCPNAKLDPIKLADEAREMLDIAHWLDIPYVIKINLLIPIEVVKIIADHPACAAVCCTNSIPFGTERLGDLTGKIDWKRLFKGKSPLAAFGGGGLSGKPLLPLVAEWIKLVRKAGIDKPLNVGGGVMHWRDVDTLVEAGLRSGIDSIFIGTVAILRPWRIRSILRRAHELLG